MTKGHWTVLQRALSKARPWQRRKGVVGVGIGQRHHEGRWVVGPACIVVKVMWKYEAEDARLRSPLPPWISVRHKGRVVRVRVDVQETREPFGTCQGVVAKGVDSGAATIGSVSAVVATGGGAQYVLISGHVGRQRGRGLVVGGVDGVTQDPVLTSSMDYCLVVPSNPLPSDAALLPNNHAIAGVVPTTDLVIDQSVYFHHTATGTRIATVLRGVDTSAPFQYPNGVVQLDGLLVTDGVSAPGDSGALLFDGNFRAVGTLVGVFGGQSYFIPCERLASLALSIC